MPLIYAIILGYVKAGNLRKALLWCNEIYVFIHLHEQKWTPPDPKLILNNANSVISNLEQTKILQKKLKTESENTDLWFNLGRAYCGKFDTRNIEDRWIYLELGWFDEAEKVFQKVLELAPKESEFSENAKHNFESIKNETKILQEELKVVVG